MRLDLLSYLEEGNFIRPKRKKFEFIEGLDDRSLSLRNLSVQENLSSSDSSHFTTFYEKKEKEDKLIMAYVDNEKTVKLFNVFDREALGEINEKPTMKIVCIDSFQVKTENEIKSYVVTLSLDNKMIITDYSSKKQIKIISNIGDTFKANKNKKNAKNIFSLSTAKNQGNIWIITSYYYDQAFKIYDDSGQLKKTVLNNYEYIISLKASKLTEENTYICVRSTSDGENQRINLFINEFYITNLCGVNDSYINFKIIKYYSYKCLIVSKIQKDLSKYSIELYDIYPILPLYIPIFQIIVSLANPRVLGLLRKFHIIPAEWKNEEAHIPMNQNLQEKIKNIKCPIITIIQEQLLPTSENQIQTMKKFYQSNNEEKYNLGNILLWENGFILVGTPFHYLDVIDCENKSKIGSISNYAVFDDNNNQEQKNEDIVIYNISEMIKDPQYGLTFIMRDNKGKIQYIRPVIVKDKFNYSIKKSDEYFNDFDVSEKLKHINFSSKFYFYYSLVSLLGPLISAFIGRDKEETETDKELIKSAFVLYAVYACIGFWFKGFVYDLNDTSHTQRTCTKRTIYFCLVMKVLATMALSYSLCQANKKGIYFVIMFCIIYLVQVIFNFCVYSFKIEFLLRTYWLGFIFYQISRLCILAFFIISVFAEVDHVETYIYAFILCVASAYMYMANYFNTLMEDIAYNSYLQAIFNYPMEWMNLFCCWWGSPRILIMELDYRLCCCDSFFLAIGECLVTIFLIFIYIIFYMFYCICSIFCAVAQEPNQNQNNNL